MGVYFLLRFGHLNRFENVCADGCRRGVPRMPEGRR